MVCLQEKSILAISLLLILCQSVGSSSLYPMLFDRCTEIITTSNSEIDFQYEACTSVIVTGSAAKDGRAILMKNRDSSQVYNVPVYHSATNDTYAFVAINSYWMGMNEKGLAVMNTAMPDLAEGTDYGSFNGPLNRIILERCENVSEVYSRLFSRTDPLIPEDADGTVASCVGVIDRFGNGAFIEVSNTQASMEIIRDGYQSRANHPRTFPGLASGPNGRDQYALDALDEIFTENDVISWQDVAQVISRNVRGKEQGTSQFGINGEVCNPNTVSAMVAVSGDQRYDGALNTVWFSYGQVPMVSVFIPSMVLDGEPPTILEDMVSYTQAKDDYATNSGTTYNPTRVREIQEYSFAAENYTFNQYDRLMDQIPQGLSETDLENTIHDFIDLTVSVASDMYVNQTSDLPDYAVQFNVTAEPSITEPISTTVTVTDSTSSTIGTTATDLIEFPSIPIAITGFAVGIILVAVVFVALARKWKE
ncbi:MAG: carcinine hydrolase/isopenicillin-N N-acyltransferase family protein [Candidatus Thorarchaeota archaeon]